MSRALIIALQYGNLPQYKLNGCFNDADNLTKRLLKIDPKMKIVTMKDNLPLSSSLFPTSANILTQLNTLVTSQEKKLFLYYSGHGTNGLDTNKDETTINITNNGKTILTTQSLSRDSCIVTNEKNKIGLIVDDSLERILNKLDAAKKMYAFFDSCNSGTILDLSWLTMGCYSGEFVSTNYNALQKEIKQKCTIVSANYPDKLKSIKGNVILITGCRDSSYSYEVWDGTKTVGLFTYHLCALLDTNVEKLSLLQFYYNIIAMINFNDQIPMLSYSQKLDLNNTMMSDLKIPANNKIVNLLESNLNSFRSLDWNLINDDIIESVNPINNNKNYNYNGMKLLLMHKNL